MKNILKSNENERIFYILVGYGIYIIISGFIFNSPHEIYLGLKKISESTGILLTDSMMVGNIGAALVNSGSVMLICLIIARIVKAKMNGILIAALLNATGFALMGKNPYNIFSLMFGVYLYCKIFKEDFSEKFYIALFATGIAPLISHIRFGGHFNPISDFVIANSIGILIGMIVPAVSSKFNEFTNGHSLYNIGFVLGTVGLIAYSILKAFGISVSSRDVLLEGYNLELSIFLMLLFFSMIAIKFVVSGFDFKEYLELLKYPGVAGTDFIKLFGFEQTFFNMGVLGLLGLLYIFLTGANINGPVICGLFALSGFGGYGKHPKNSIPIMLGVFLATYLTMYETTKTSNVIAALFGTTLAPIAGSFGFFAGVIAGIVHLILVNSTGEFHGYLVLYNNGFSGGIVAAVLVPIFEKISSLKKKPFETELK